MSPSKLTLDEEAIAFSQAHPTTPYGIQKQGLRGPELELVFQTSGVALIDYYFCAALTGIAQGDVSSSELERALHGDGDLVAEGVALAWELAREAIRQRPKPTPKDTNGPGTRLLR